MNRLLLPLVILTAASAQAWAIDPVEVCQLECVRTFNACLAKTAGDPVRGAKCEANRFKCICDCSKHENDLGGDGPFKPKPMPNLPELPRE